VQIDKQQIIQFLISRGQQDKAAQAESELPDQVDPESHAGLLSKLGIDPQDLLANLPGGLGGIAGGLGGLGGL
jgi:hypothetical protein